MLVLLSLKDFLMVGAGKFARIDEILQSNLGILHEIDEILGKNDVILIQNPSLIS